MIDEHSSKSSSEPVGVPKTRRQRKKWELDQTIKYCEFVKKFRSTLEETEKKQKQRIYNKMAEYIGTRTTHQCRSHHQKIVKRYNSIDGFLQEFTKKVDSARTFTEWSKAELEGFEFLKNQESRKFLDHLYFKKPTNLQANPNPNILKPLFQLNPPFLPHAATKNPSQRQGPFMSGSFKNFQISNPPNFDKSQAAPSVPFGKRPDQHHEKEISNFHVSSPVRKTIVLRNNGQAVPTVYLQAERGPQKMVEFSNGYYFPHHVWQMNSEKEQWHDRDQMYQARVPVESFSNCGGQRNASNKEFKNQIVDESLPSSQILKQSSDSRVDNAAQICNSLLRRRNLNVIGPLVRENHVELTSDRIRIQGKESSEYNYWIECRKFEELSEASEVESESEEIQRELVEEILTKVLVDFGIIPKPIFNYSNYTGYQDPTLNFIPDYQSHQFRYHPNFTNIDDQTQKRECDGIGKFGRDFMEDQLSESPQFSRHQPFEQQYGFDKNAKIENPHYDSEQNVIQKTMAYREFMQRLQQKKKSQQIINNGTKNINPLEIINEDQHVVSIDNDSQSKNSKSPQNNHKNILVWPRQLNPQRKDSNPNLSDSDSQLQLDLQNYPQLFKLKNQIGGNIKSKFSSFQEVKDPIKSALEQIRQPLIIGDEANQDVWSKFDKNSDKFLEPTTQKKQEASIDSKIQIGVKEQHACT